MGLPKYIINMDELAGLLKDGINMQLNPEATGLTELLTDYMEKIIKLLELINSPGSPFMQCVLGLHSYIPALNFDYELIHIFDEDVYITGITYSQTGWKVMDCWSLYIDDALLFDGIFTKELGEYKHFNAFYSVQAGREIKIVHHNNSGNSKQIWYDIHYLKINPNPYIPPEPPEPPDETIEPGEAIEVIVKLEEIIEIGYIEIGEGFSGDLIITMNFATISGASFPDLECSAPNGDTFGFSREYLKGPNEEIKTALGSCLNAAYSGYNSNPEQMVFSQPMPGKWHFYGQSIGGELDSVVTFTSNQPVFITYNR